MGTVVGVGTSQNWDARKAAIEAIDESLVEKPNKPTFILLFSTIHYEENKGFHIILEEIYKHVPQSTPLIGGTVAGFINQKGCYTRGVTIFCCYSDELEVAQAIGINTKSSPDAAGLKCATQLADFLENTKYKHKIIFNIISGVTMPQILGKSRAIVIKDIPAGQYSDQLLEVSTKYLQKGVAREEEVLSILREKFPDTHIFGGSTIDDNFFSRSYEFYNNTVNSNSIVTLAISTNYLPIIQSNHGFKKKGPWITNFKTKLWKRILSEIDGFPAVPKYFELLKWSRDLIDERTFHRRLIFNPLGYEDLEGELHPFVSGAFIGNDYISGGPVAGNKICLLSTSGKDLAELMKEPSEIGQSPFAIFTFCASRFETLRNKLYITHKKITQNYGGPFIVIATAGENFSTPKNKIKNLMITSNALFLRKENE